MQFLVLNGRIELIKLYDLVTMITTTILLHVYTVTRIIYSSGSQIVHRGLF